MSRHNLIIINIILILLFIFVWTEIVTVRKMD